MQNYITNIEKKPKTKQNYKKQQQQKKKKQVVVVVVYLYDFLSYNCKHQSRDFVTCQ